MLKTNTIKGNKRYIVIFIKSIITIALVWLIYRRLFIEHQFSQLLDEFSFNRSASSKYFFILCLFLLFVNWSLEAFRWKLMVNQYYKISFAEALKGIFIGLTFGVVSPQRIGEFAGRLMVLPVEKNWLSIRASFYGSLAMNIIVVICGLLAYLGIQAEQVTIPALPSNLFYFSIVPTLIVFVTLYLFFPHIEKIFKLFKLTSKLKSWGSFEDYPFKKITLLKVILISFIRYAVFVLQYFLIIKFIGIELEAVKIFSLIGIIYLAQSIIPLPGLMNLVARGEIAMAVFSLYNVNEISILLATFTLWIINLLIPSLIGLGLLWRIPILKSLGIEK